MRDRDNLKARPVAFRAIAPRARRYRFTHLMPYIQISPDFARRRQKTRTMAPHRFRDRAVKFDGTQIRKRFQEAQAPFLVASRLSAKQLEEPEEFLRAPAFFVRWN